MVLHPSQPPPAWIAHICYTRFDTQDSLYDLSWSETHENQVLVAAGDGSVKLFDIGLDDFPVQSWKEHNREVFAVHWNLVTKDSFCSSSWDGTVKVVRNDPSVPKYPYSSQPFPSGTQLVHNRS